MHNKPYIVFHDAYQYFERRYGMKAVGVIQETHNDLPSPYKVRTMRHLMERSGVVCVLREPQFSDRMALTITSGTDIKSVVADPLGADIEPGAEAYSKIMWGLANSLKECLS